MVEIPWLDPFTAYRTLGAWIAADGNKHLQLEVLKDHSTIWTEAIGHSSLTQKEKKQIA